MGFLPRTQLNCQSQSHRRLHPRRLPHARELRPDHGRLPLPQPVPPSAVSPPATGRATTRRRASADRAAVCDLAAGACCRGASGRVATTSRAATTGRAVSTGLAAARDHTAAFRMWVVVAAIPSPLIHKTVRNPFGTSFKRRKKHDGSFDAARRPLSRHVRPSS